MLRKIFGGERVAAIWHEALSDDVQPGCACPMCQSPTARVIWPEQDKPLSVDLCRRCEFAWFAPETYESISPTVVRHRLGDVDMTKLPIDLRERMAMEKVRDIAQQANDAAESPDDGLSLALAMFGFPVETDASAPVRAPVATYGLAGTISVVSLWGFLLARSFHRDVLDQFGLIADQPWRMHGLTFLTSFLLHGSLLHLLGNLYFLVVFGRQVEDYLGPGRWLLLIAAAALAGDLLDLALTQHGTAPLVGASGGISGLLVFYAFILPRARLSLFFSFTSGSNWLTIPAWGMFALWLLTQIWGAYLEWEQTSNIASIAHLGGVAAGIGFWLLWRNLDAKSTVQSTHPRIRIRS